MTAIERLCDAYRRLLTLPWSSATAGPERVWMAIYQPQQERRLGLRLGEFETATHAAQHRWRHIDLTNTFPRWMATHPYREAYFASPDDMQMALADFAAFLRNLLAQQLADADDNTVVAVSGAASLFGLASVSRLIEQVAPAVRGRLLVFFPGSREANNYRLLDARDGWNYLATPIEANEGG